MTALTIALFDHAKDNRVKPKLTTWEGLRDNLQKFRDIEHFLPEQKKEVKESQPAWSPARYKPNTPRANDNVEAIGCLVLDLDDKPWEPVKALLEPYEYVVHTTFSHTENSERLRVVLPLTREVLADEYATFWDATNQWLGNVNDPSTKDLARIHFRPVTHSGNDYHSDVHQGKWLNPDNFLNGSQTQHTATTNNFPTDAPLDSLSAIQNEWLSKRKEVGSRHATCLRCLIAVLGLAQRGANKDDVNKTLRWLRRQFVAEVKSSRGSAQSAEDEFADCVIDALCYVDKHQATGTASDDDKKTIVDKIVDIAETFFRFTISHNGDLYAIPLNRSPIAAQLKDGFRDDLAYLFRNQTGKTAKKGSIDDAISVLAGNAKSQPREPVYYRSADLHNRVVVDLGTTDGRVVDVDGNGWRVKDCSDVTFTRSEATSPLPTPTTANLDRLRPLVNTSDADFKLYKAWLSYAYLNRPCPILFPEANQGAGKTSLARLTKRFTDPSLADLTSQPRDSAEWLTTATNSKVVAVDDVTRVPEWFAGELKRAVTGIAALRRSLYTNNTPKVYQYQLALIITSVDLAALPPDLVQRTLTLNLLPIPDTQRMTEQQISDYVNKHEGEIIAGVFDQLAKALSVLETVDVVELDRMADFCQFLAAIDKVNGTTTLQHYRDNVNAAQANLVKADDFGAVLLEYLTDNLHVGKSLQFTSAQLLSELQKYVTQKAKVTTQTFPQRPEQVSSKLSKYSEPLRNVGVEVERPPRTSTARFWKFTRLGGDGMTAMTPEPYILSLDLKENEREKATVKEATA